MTTIDEIAEWCEGAAEAYGDPSLPVGQIFARWTDDLRLLTGDDIECGNVNGEVSLKLGPGFLIPLCLGTNPEVSPDTGLIKFGAACVYPGVWALDPSLNIPGLVHVFVVLVGVPTPPPWEALEQTPREISISGICARCGCSELNACHTAYGPCEWANEERTLCTGCEPRKVRRVHA